MKKIIFLVLFYIPLALEALVTCDYNSAVDKLNTSSLNIGVCKDLTTPYNELYDGSCGDNLLVKFTNELYTNYCTYETVVKNKKYNQQIYSVQHNYTGCLSGQEIINGVCATPPTCAAGTAWDSLTDICKPIPPPDADADGTPDKCDYDFVNYKTLDCDGDGIANGTDDDIDGDGFKNSADTDSNNDGIPDASDASSPFYNATCQGADGSADKISYGVAYSSFAYYNSRGSMTTSACRALVDDYENIDSSISLPDVNKNCNSTYCYTHTVGSNCNYTASSLIPDGDLWIYYSSAKTQDSCFAMVDGVKYIDKHWAFPDPAYCSAYKYCFLKRVDNTPLPEDNNAENTDESMKAPDLNSTTSDLAPLLNAQNTTNKHLDDLKLKVDISNNHLDDLKKTANDSFNMQVDIKSVLSDLKSNSDRSLENDLLSSSALNNAVDGISKTNKTIGVMSDTITANQGVINNNLTDMGFTLDFMKGLLSDGLMGDNPFPDAPDDGSSGFGEKQTILTDNLSITYKPNFLGLSSVSGSISPVTFSIQGRSYTLLGADTINQLPVEAIRALFLFLGAVTGFITIFLTV